MPDSPRIQSIAVVGAGLMGRAIARLFALGNHSVTLFDTSEAQLASAKQQITDVPMAYTSNIQDLADNQFVLEAVFEDLNVKRDVLGTLSQIVSEDCIIATNTSSLLVGDLASAVKSPTRFLGVHFNNPADFNPIVEIIAGQDTDPSITKHVTRMIEATGKIAIACGDTSGFVLNRQSLPYMNEAVRCLEDTLADTATIDEVARTELGVGLGPFAVMNLVGLPIMAAASHNLAVLGDGYEPAALLQSQSKEADPTWVIADTGAKEAKAMSSHSVIAERLRAAMIFPGRDILNHNLVAEESLTVICKQALGYQTSSPELLKQLGDAESTRLIDEYLARL